MRQHGLMGYRPKRVAARLPSWHPAAPVHADGFTEDERIAKIAEAYALDAVDSAKRNFGVTLDWSIESIRQIETMLGQLHDAIHRERPSDDEIEAFSKMMGSYVGEVIRREHGGSWGMLKAGDEQFPGLSLGHWPWSRAYKRIVNGPEDNVWHYYVMLVRDADRG